MFGLILAVGMLVDGAIVVVEYADKRISDGAGPMEAYTEAAKRMFWPIISSTATTLCAFLPMLFWPGIPGEFMGMLPVTLIFVLSASLVVALGLSARYGRRHGADGPHFRRCLRRFVRRLPWGVRAALVLPAHGRGFTGAMLTLNPDYLSGDAAQTSGSPTACPAWPFLARRGACVDHDGCRQNNRRQSASKQAIGVSPLAMS